MAFNNMKNQKSSFVESFTKKSYWIEKKLLKIYLKEIRKLRTKVKMDFSGTVVRV